MGRSNIVEEIKAQGNIVDIIGNYVNLKKTGNNYKGCCPFHNEKTPSFIVSEDKQIFTCFGCGATGDIFKFIQQIENLEFYEAVEKLAEKMNIQMENSEFNVKNKNKTRYYEINRLAAHVFYDNIQDGNNNGARYMKERGLTSNVMKKFGIGYARDGWEDLITKLSAKEIDEKDMLDLGLISKNASGKCFDKFRNRVIFPIINTSGKVIGFGGRAIGNDTPKYLNSPETVVFSKKNNLFGLNLTRKDINKRNCIILVEGYMDVIALYQYGVRNVAASLGTALTANQAAMIKRYADNAVIAYDTDSAGQAAAIRAIDLLYEAGCNIKILQVTGAKDPDEFVRVRGADAFYELAERAPTFVEFKVNLAKQKYDMATTSGSVGFLKEVTDILKALKSPVEADVYIEKIAADAKISAGAIRNEIYGNKKPDAKIQNHSDVQGKYYTSQNVAGGRISDNEKTRASDFLEKSLIKLMLIYPEFIPRIENRTEVFQNPLYLKIFETIRSIYSDDNEVDVRKLKDNLTDNENDALTELSKNVILGNDEEIFFRDCIKKIQNEKFKKREREILEILTILDEEDNADEIRAIHRELMEIRKQKSSYGV